MDCIGPRACPRSAYKQGAASRLYPTCGVKARNDRNAITAAPAALPEHFRDVEHLEEVMTAPSRVLAREFAGLAGDLIILGVGGKIGPTLARLAKRAAPGKRVVGVARFSEKGLREQLAAGDV